jgi:hypothetical protein
MPAQRSRRIAPQSVLFLLGTVFAAAQVHAQSNDDWSNATVITALPFTDAVTTSAATTESSDPESICFIGAAGSQGRGSVWYRYTTGASDEYLNISTAGSSYDTIVNVYQGSPGTFQPVIGGCNDDGIVGVFQARLSGLRLAAATSYSIEVVSHGTSTFGGSLQLAVSLAPQYLVTRSDDPNPALAACAPGDCSLRAAIKSANTTPGAVIVPAGNYAITLGSSGEDANNGGDFDIRAGMGIYGAGIGQTVINAGNLDRAFDIDPSGASASGRVTAIIADLSIINGGGSSFFGDGGAIRAYDSGGGNLSNDFIALQRVRISNSRSQLNGGAIALSARGMIHDSEFSSNYANSTGGALTLGPSFGGGDTTIDIFGSTIANNQSPSSFSGGGGIKSTARLRLTNSTVYGNTTGYHGGGLYLTGTGNVELRSSTIVANIARSSGSGSANGGGLRIDGGTVNLANTLIAGNTTGSGAGSPDDCTAGGGTLGANYSLIRDGAACVFAGTGNINGSDPLVDSALADNGGATRTLALTEGSPAIDAGNPGGCRDRLGQMLAFDQRGQGYVRSSGSACDIGAYERSTASVPAPDMPVLASESDSGSSSNDGITNIAQPHLQGTCTDGDTMTLLIDGNAILPTALCASSAFDIVPATPLADGMHLVAATATRAGDTSAASPALSILIDTVAPAVSVTAGPNGTVVDASATFSFAIGDGLAAECRLDATAFGACSSPAQYSGLALGAHAFDVRAADLAGNVGSDTRSWTVAAPAAPSMPALDASTDSGRFADDGVTNAGSLLFTGSCVDGDLMQLYDAGSAVAGASACNAGYAISVAGLGEGMHTISVSATRGGLESNPSGSLAILIDRSAPTAPVILGPIGPAAAHVDVSGQAEANADITVREAATILCTTISGNDGSWSCSAQFAGGGVHTVIAMATDLAGNSGPDSMDFVVSVDQIFASGFDN